MTNVLSARFKVVVKNFLENVGFRPLFINDLHLIFLNGQKLWFSVTCAHKRREWRICTI